jgi:hypothetical protein
MAFNAYHIAKKFPKCLDPSARRIENRISHVFCLVKGCSTLGARTEGAGSKRASPFSLVMQNQEATDSFVTTLTTAFSGSFLT